MKNEPNNFEKENCTNLRQIIRERLVQQAEKGPFIRHELKGWVGTRHIIQEKFKSPNEVIALEFLFGLRRRRDANINADTILWHMNL